MKKTDFLLRLRHLFSTYEDAIRQGLKDISKGSRTSDEEMNNLLDYFLYCLQPAMRNRIQIFSLDSNFDLDDTIFEAIIQGILLPSTDFSLLENDFSLAKQKKNNTGLDREQLLQLALAWNAIEVAKEHIIKDDLSNLNVRSIIDWKNESVKIDHRRCSLKPRRHSFSKH